MRLRVVSFNIHKGIGGIDRKYRPERTVEAIKHYDPDLVLLQEVDEQAPRSQAHRQVDLIADGIGLRHRAYQRNVTLKTGFYGNAVISRFPLSEVHDLDLSVPLKKRRRALVGHCRIRCDRRERSMLLYNVHLGLAGYERTAQLKKVLQSEELIHVHKHTPVLIAGDFNDVWGGLGKRCLEPSGFRSATSTVKTFPAVLPVRPLDRIYYRGDLELDHCFAARTEVARQASDHRPLVADFHLTFPQR